MPKHLLTWETRRDAYLENSLEIAQALLRVEEEGVGGGTELCEGSIIWSEDGGTCHLNTVDKFGKVCLFIGEK